MRGTRGSTYTHSGSYALSTGSPGPLISFIVHWVIAIDAKKNGLDQGFLCKMESRVAGRIMLSAAVCTDWLPLRTQSQQFRTSNMSTVGTPSHIGDGATGLRVAVVFSSCKCRTGSIAAHFTA